jgi:hypothetical protein
MNYAQEFQAALNPIADRLSAISRSLAQANAEPTDAVVIAHEEFEKALFKAKLFVAIGLDDPAEAELVKARLSATGDILADAMLEQKAALGL